MRSMSAIRTKAEEVVLETINEEADSAAAQWFAETGLPHRRMEAWKYTDIRAFWREPLKSAPQPDAATIKEAEALAPLPESKFLLTFVNGWLTSKAGVPQGVTIQPVQNDTAPALWDDPALKLNAVLTGATVMITIPDGVTLDAPLHLNYRMAGAPSSTYPSVHIHAGKDSRVTIIETHVSAEETYVLNSTLIITCSRGAEVSHVRVQTQGSKTLNIVSTDVRLNENVRFSSFALEEGAALSRNQYFVTQAGEETEISLSGISLGKGKQHLDTTLVIDHSVPNSVSREMFKQVLTGESHGVFQGKIIVRPHAQKTDGQMNARGLLLSDDAEFYAKPELEIYADDVLCAHGATAGQLDEDLLFYLRARGLPEGEARAMLVSAFVGEALEKIDHEPLREALSARCEAWLKENLH
ncbi:MAG: Fe-S cluster assembly protein SufD [Pseudomonadota bacterium]